MTHESLNFPPFSRMMFKRLPRADAAHYRGRWFASGEASPPLGGLTPSLQLHHLRPLDQWGQVFYRNSLPLEEST